MCGICGEFRFDPSAEGASDFDGLIDRMDRRGPDDRGQWAHETCRLGFRRLAILDLSRAANQPMLAEDRFALVFNGELYNFRELRVELERAGATFRTTGDAEVALQALARWGTAALDRFNGMFALGFYDATRKSLLLARDPVGIKPLYTLETGAGILFASQFDVILAHPWSRDLPVSRDALGLYLRLGYIPAPFAMLEGTAMLQPGSWLEASAGGGVTRGRYYAFPVYQVPDLRGEAACEAVDAAVTNAVRRQLISDVPLGAFLSGGIDSPLVAAIATDAGNGPLKAFTIGSGDEHDEVADARAYARRLRVDHVVEQYTPDKAVAWLDRVVEACQEPLADISIFPTMLVSKLARRDVTVMLSGDGGDELFWGYTARFAPVLRLADGFRRPQWWRSGRHGAARLRGDRSLRNLRWPTIGDWYRAQHTRIAEPLLATVIPNAPGWPAGWNLFAYDGWEADETAQWLRWNELEGHLTRVLLKVDRASMYHSLEVRVPLLDREVLATAARVDWRSCLDLAADVGKLPLRAALARRVTRQTRDKRGFGVPMAEWLRGPLLPVFRDEVLARPDLLGLPLNRGALESALEDHVQDRADHSGWLWSLLSLALWNRRYFRR